MCNKFMEIVRRDWGFFRLEHYLVHITLGRKKDPFFLNIRNPIPQKVKRIPDIDPDYI